MIEFSHTGTSVYVHVYMCMSWEEYRVRSLKVMSYTSAYKNLNSNIIYTVHTQQENTSLVAALRLREVKGQDRLHV